MRFLLTTLLALLTVGCTTISSDHYVGEPFPAFADYEKTVSVWKFNAVIFHVMPIDDFRARVERLEWQEDEQSFISIGDELLISRLNDYTFFNLKKSEKSDRYEIYRVTGTDDLDFVVFLPDGKKLKADLAAGRIKTVPRISNGDEYNYHLDMTKAELDRYIGEQGLTLFNTNNIGVITSVVPPEEE